MSLVCIHSVYTVYCVYWNMYTFSSRRSVIRTGVSPATIQDGGITVSSQVSEVKLVNSNLIDKLRHLAIKIKKYVINPWMLSWSQSYIDVCKEVFWQRCGVVLSMVLKGESHFGRLYNLLTFCFNVYHHIPPVSWGKDKDGYTRKENLTPCTHPYMIQPYTSLPNICPKLHLIGSYKSCSEWCLLSFTCCLFIVFSIEMYIEFSWFSLGPVCYVQYSLCNFKFAQDDGSDLDLMKSIVFIPKTNMLLTQVNKRSLWL